MMIQYSTLLAGVIAARTLHEHGHDNFVIIEAQDELGGRMMSRTFGTPGKQRTIELGANWVQGETCSKAIFIHKAISDSAIGTQVGNGPKNPILTLAEKHKVQTIPVRIMAPFVSLNLTHQNAV